MCDVEGWHVAHLWIPECNHRLRDHVGFALGIVSIGFWLVAQLPQIITNIRAHCADALSPYFLAEWLLGDTSNLIGCLLTGTQLATQTYTAMYYVFMDCVLVIQYVYYTSLRRRHERHYFARIRNFSRNFSGSFQDSDRWRPQGGLSATALQNSSTPNAAMPPRVPSGRVLACVMLLAFFGLGVVPPVMSGGSLSGGHVGPSVMAPASGGGMVFRRSLRGSGPAAPLSAFLEPRPAWAMVAGQALGYASMILYLSSRVSQIKRNYARKSTEGLAKSMFMAAIMANVSYGSSILVRTYSSKQLLDSLPWILGSLGTVALDFAILYQSLLYKRREKEVRQPLLETGGAGE